MFSVQAYLALIGSFVVYLSLDMFLTFSYMLSHGRGHSEIVFQSYVPS